MREHKKIIAEIKGWKICPLICYDLRFPVWARRTKKEDYDVLIYIANWPERRSYPWKSLLVARAIENQCYVVGLNRIGKDGHEMNHSGDSIILNSKGEGISSTKPFVDSEETIKLSYAELIDFRTAFPAAEDADAFAIVS